MKTSTIALVVSFVGLAACASTTPTPELVSARTAYDHARTAPNSALVPESVLTAKQALDKAESAHQSDPQSETDRSFSYVAQRRAELAISLGDNARAKKDAEEAAAHYSSLQDNLRTSAVKREGALTSQLATAKGDASNTRQALAQEKDARKAAEDRATRAMESLSKIAQVKEESRGMVITLSGQVLFVTGKAELLPVAQDQLNLVAKALLDEGEIKPMVVEGYTDNVGTKSANQKLSQDRAEAVRAYLVSKGLPSEKVTAAGKGDSNPVAPNTTPDGRANNRRVEIVVSGSPKN